MGMTKSPVLVLNASYEPIAICAVKRAMTMLVNGIARVEESTNKLIYREMKVPSVIRLLRYRKVPVRRNMVSRKNILLRDRYTCQYCRQKLAPVRLTLDHVHPRSRGGQATWENLVASCHSCNRRKDDRTPEEAGMPLFHQPRMMSLHAARNLMRSMGEEDPLWRKYLYFD
jgi:5-methylcytosine-specific restriction endonuclease McrA